jgi:hypothetical protein
MSMHLRLVAAHLSGAALLALVAAAPAQGDSVIYTDQANVVAASVDGVSKRSLTTNGTEGEPYRSPSADDGGRWLAARSGTWFWHAADGSLLSADLVDKGRCESLNTGPTAGRLDPTGDFVAFESLCSGFAGQSITPRVVINFPGRPTLGNAPVIEGFRQPTWMGRRLVADGGNGTFVQDDNAEAPVTTAFGRWLPSATGRAEISRDRRRALITVKPQDGNPEELWLARLDADPVAGLPTAACKVPIQGSAGRAGFSPDGTRVVWRDDRGVVVAPAYTPPPSGTERVDPCSAQVVPGAPIVLSATGNEPSFTPADLHAVADSRGPGAGRPGDPASPDAGKNPETKPPAGGSPGGPSADDRLRITVPRRLRVAGLLRGVLLPVRAPAAGSGRVVATVSARDAHRLRLGRSRTLASARFTARRAGTVEVQLRAGRRTAARLRGVRRLNVTIAVRFKTEGAPTQTVRLRRALR